jgi:HK97 family phage portal protein
MYLDDGSIVLAPQALAELNPIIPQGYYYADHVGIDLEYRHALYGKIYETNPWVHTVIEKRAHAVARLPVNVWDVDKAGTRVLDTTSQYARLIADPCEYMDPFSFWNWVQTTIDIYGETYLAIARDANGVPEGFWPMHPSRVAIKRDPKTGRYTYYFQAGSGIGTELVSFDQSNVVPFKLFHPEKLERGMSRMEAIRTTIFAEDSARNAVNSWWKNSGRPGMILESDKKLNPDGAKKLRLAVEQSHSGSSNTGRTLVLEDGVTAKPFQLSAVDLELISARKMNREEIAAVYDIAPTLVGILEHATFSNVSEQMRGFYRDTMAPVIEFIQSVVDKYVGSYWQRKNIMRFAVDDVIRGDFEVRAKQGQAAVMSGGMTPNEYRELLGLNRMNDPKADKLYANSAMQPLGEPAENIRIMGELTGPTPDGIAGPMSTPVASLNGSEPNMVPALTSGRPQGPNNANPSTTPTPKHLHRIKSEAGRGRSEEQILAFAYKLYQENPEDLDDLLEAVEIARAERDRKRNTHADLR